MNSPINELVHMFREEPGFARLFALLHAKYRSYGRLEKQVTVLLKQPSPEERDALGGLLGKDYAKARLIRVSVAHLEAAIRRTKFGHVLENTEFVQLVEAYFGRTLSSKREDATRFVSERAAYFERLKQPSNAVYAERLLTWITGDGHGQNRFYALFRHNRRQLDAVMRVLLDVCKALPLEEDTYLPLFAARITGDPHAFDPDRDTGKLLIYMLQILKTMQENRDADRDVDGHANEHADEHTDEHADEHTDERTVAIRHDLNAEETAELLLEYRILRDDLLNFVTLFHISGKLRNGRECQLFQGASHDGVSFHLPLKEVIRLESVRAASRENILYMIENSGVAAHIINQMTSAPERSRVSILSGNGQLNLATLRFLDIFVAGGGVVYYAGDFDPEGLGITQKLLYRYDDSIRLWMYRVDDYKQTLSRTPIPPERLKQLDSIDHPALQDVKNEMTILQKAGYQENILDAMLDDLRRRL